MNTPKTVTLGHWFMDTKLPIPFKWKIGEYIKYELTPDKYWGEL